MYNPASSAGQGVLDVEHDTAEKKPQKDQCNIAGILAIGKESIAYF